MKPDQMWHAPAERDRAALEDETDAAGRDVLALPIALIQLTCKMRVVL